MSKRGEALKNTFPLIWTLYIWRFSWWDIKLKMKPQPVYRIMEGFILIVRKLQRSCHVQFFLVLTLTCILFQKLNNTNRELNFYSLIIELIYICLVMSHTLRKSIFQRVFVGVSRELIWQVNRGSKWIAKGNGDERKLCMVHCYSCNIYGTSRWWGATLKSSYGREQATKGRRFFMGGVDPSRRHE